MQDPDPETVLSEKIRIFDARLSGLQERKRKIQSHRGIINQLYNLLKELNTKEVSILGGGSLLYKEIIKKDIRNLYHDKIAEHKQSIRELLEEQ